MNNELAFLKDYHSLQAYFESLYSHIKSSGLLSSEILSNFTHPRLKQPKDWFEALATLEYAIDTGFDTRRTEEFFLKVFLGYDCNASVNLTDEDYRFYWQKINDIADKFAVQSSEALVEKALQYFNPRREYGDYNKTLSILQQAVERGNETAQVLLGYYLFMGFYGVTDEEKGSKLMTDVTDPIQKQRADVYKGYILLRDGKQEESRELLDQLLKEEIHPSIQRLVDEQRAFYFEQDQKYEEAAACYRKLLEHHATSFSMMHLGILHYNQSIEGADQREGLRLMEESFNFGRWDVARSLFYCYFNSGQEWQDNERAYYWIQKGYQYYDGYSTYQLSYLHLFYEEYKDIEKGLFYLDKAIELNYADAIACKASMHQIGDFVEQDTTKAVELFAKSIELGSGYAAYRLGALHEQGVLNNGENDYASALPYYEKAVELGELLGYEIAGRYHLTGAAGEANIEKAFDYYTKGAEYGSAYCMVELAFMYEEGNGVEQNSPKMYELVKQAVEKSYPYAYYLLGRCYRHGLGTEENPDEAIKYLQMAADENIAKAQTELALCYEEGYAVEQNGKKALEYMLKAAEQDYPYAQYKAGCYYLYGLDGIATDYDESFKWTSKAVENEYPYAMLELGDYYFYDYNNKEENQNAYTYYAKAAEYGLVSEGLGLCLEYGMGIEENEAEAFKYYLKAAEDNYIRAMYHVARCYYYGYGIKENLDEAFRWFNDASVHEFLPAIYFKGKMLLAGEGCAQNMEEGINLLKKAAGEDYTDAIFDLANCYLAGKGVTADEDMAMELFEKAADNGHEQALKVTGRRRKK